MDLNQALETCRGGMYIRDDLNMSPDWVIYYDKKLKSFFYINPKTGPAYEVTFRDAMKASYAWRAMSDAPTKFVRPDDVKPTEEKIDEQTPAK